jgi:uncharacterized protein YaaQ
MKMLVLIVPGEHTHTLKETLQTGGFRSTHMASTGGFLRQSMDTLLLGMEDDQLASALALVQDVINRLGVQIPYFVLNVQRFEKV